MSGAATPVKSNIQRLESTLKEQLQHVAELTEMHAASEAAAQKLQAEVKRLETSTHEVSSASFLAELSVWSPRKLFIFIILKKKSGSKYPKIKLFNFEKGSTGGKQPPCSFVLAAIACVPEYRSVLLFFKIK